MKVRKLKKIKQKRIEYNLFKKQVTSIIQNHFLDMYKKILKETLIEDLKNFRENNNHKG